MPRGKRPHLVGSAEGQTAVVHQDPGRGRSALFLRHHVTFFTERDRLDGTSVRIDAPLSTVKIVGCLLAIGLAFVAIGSDIDAFRDPCEKPYGDGWTEIPALEGGGVFDSKAACCTDGRLDQPHPDHRQGRGVRFRPLGLSEPRPTASPGPREHP